jgi:hypothetical protein
MQRINVEHGDLTVVLGGKETMDGYLGDEECDALLKVAEAAAVLFRPPYRRGGCGMQLMSHQKETDDFQRLYDALNNTDCPVEIGEQLT